MSEQSNQHSPDLTFFKGQMAARYRERLSMGFGVSSSDMSCLGAIPSTEFQWSASKPGPAEAGGEQDDKSHKLDQPGAGEIKIPPLPTTRSRSLSGEQGSETHKPAMKDLISKFERRSFTATHLKQAKEDAGQIRFSKEGNFPGIKMELDPTVLAPSSLSDDPEALHSNSPALQVPFAKSFRAAVHLNNEPQTTIPVCSNLAYVNEISNVQAGGRDTSIETPDQNHDFRTNVMPSSLPNWKKDCIDLEVNVSQNGAQTQSSEPQHQENEPIQTQAGAEATPLRVNLREYANQTKSAKANNMKYIVHKKEWGNRFQNRCEDNPDSPSPVPKLGPSPVPKLGPVPLEQRSRSRNEKDIAAVKTPSNTQQRLEKRSWHRQVEVKGEAEPKPEERKENAMDRYLKFLKRSSTPQLATHTPNTPNEAFKEQEKEKPVAQKAIKPPAFQRTQIQRKTRENLSKKALSNTTEEGQAGKRQGYGQAMRQALMKKQTMDKDARAEVLSRYRPADSRSVMGEDSNKIHTLDPSGGDTVANMAFSSSMSIPSSVYEDSKKPDTMEHSKPDIYTSRLPKALQTKAKPNPSNISLKSITTKQNSFTTKGQPVHDQKDLRTEGKHTKTTMSAKSKVFNPPALSQARVDKSRFGITSKSGVPRNEVSRSPFGHEPEQHRSVSAYRRFAMSKGNASKSLKEVRCKSNSPESNFKTSRTRIKHPTSQTEQNSEFSNIAGHLLTKDELADNDLIPSHLRDRTSQIVKGDVCPDNSSSDDSCSVRIQNSIKRLQAKRILNMFEDRTEEQIVTADTEFLRKTLGLVRQNDLKKNDSANSKPDSPGESRGHFGLDRVATPNQDSANFHSIEEEPVLSRYLSHTCKTEAHKARDTPSPKESVWRRDTKTGTGTNQISSVNPDEFASAISLTTEEKLAVNKNPHNTKVGKCATREEGNKQTGTSWSPSGKSWIPRHTHTDLTKRNYGFKIIPDPLNSTMAQGRDTPSAQRQKETSHAGAGDLEIAENTQAGNIKHRKDTQQKHSQPAYHFGDPETRTELNVDGGNRMDKLSPRKKKRKVEKTKKPKKKKRKNKEDDDDDKDVTQSQALTKSNKDKLKEAEHTSKERPRDKSPGGKDRSVSTERTKAQTGELKPKPTSSHPSVSPDKQKTLEISPKLDQAKIQQLAVRRYNDEIQPLQHSPEASMAGMASRNRSITKECSIPQTWHSLWKDSWIHTKPLRPVKPLDSGPNARWQIQSHIPTITYKMNETYSVVPGNPRRKMDSPRSRINILVQYRRWREAMLDAEHPCRIPLSDAFRRTLDMAVVEEWALHCWEPTQMYLGSPDASWWNLQNPGSANGCYTPMPEHVETLDTGYVAIDTIDTEYVAIDTGYVAIDSMDTGYVAVDTMDTGYGTIDAIQHVESLETPWTVCGRKEIQLSHTHHRRTSYCIECNYFMCLRLHVQYDDGHNMARNDCFIHNIKLSMKISQQTCMCEDECVGNRLIHIWGCKCDVVDTPEKHKVPDTSNCEFADLCPNINNNSLDRAFDKVKTIKTPGHSKVDSLLAESSLSISTCGKSEKQKQRNLDVKRRHRTKRCFSLLRDERRKLLNGRKVTQSKARKTAIASRSRHIKWLIIDSLLEIMNTSQNFPLSVENTVERVNTNECFTPNYHQFSESQTKSRYAPENGNQDFELIPLSTSPSFQALSDAEIYDHHHSHHSRRPRSRRFGHRSLSSNRSRHKGSGKIPYACFSDESLCKSDRTKHDRVLYNTANVCPSFFSLSQSCGDSSTHQYLQMETFSPPYSVVGKNNNSRKPGNDSGERCWPNEGKKSLQWQGQQNSTKHLNGANVKKIDDVNQRIPSASLQVRRERRKQRAKPWKVVEPAATEKPTAGNTGNDWDPMHFDTGNKLNGKSVSKSGIKPQACNFPSTKVRLEEHNREPPLTAGSRNRVQHAGVGNGLSHFRSPRWFESPSGSGNDPYRQRELKSKICSLRSSISSGRPYENDDVQQFTSGWPTQLSEIRTSDGKEPNEMRKGGISLNYPLDTREKTVGIGANNPLKAYQKVSTEVNSLCTFKDKDSQMCMKPDLSYAEGEGKMTLGHTDGMDFSQRIALGKVEDMESQKSSSTFNEETVSGSQTKERKLSTSKLPSNRTIADPKMFAEVQRKVKAMVQSYREFLEKEIERGREETTLEDMTSTFFTKSLGLNSNGQDQGQEIFEHNEDNTPDDVLVSQGIKNEHLDHIAVEEPEFQGLQTDSFHKNPAAKEQVTKRFISSAKQPRWAKSTVSKVTANATKESGSFKTCSPNLVGNRMTTQTRRSCSNSKMKTTGTKYDPEKRQELQSEMLENQAGKPAITSGLQLPKAIKRPGIVEIDGYSQGIFNLVQPSDGFFFKAGEEEISNGNEICVVMEPNEETVGVEKAEMTQRERDKFTQDTIEANRYLTCLVDNWNVSVTAVSNAEVACLSQFNASDKEPRVCQKGFLQANNSIKGRVEPPQKGRNCLGFQKQSPLIRRAAPSRDGNGPRQRVSMSAGIHRLKMEQISRNSLEKAESRQGNKKMPDTCRAQEGKPALRLRQSQDRTRFGFNRQGTFKKGNAFNARAGSSVGTRSVSKPENGRFGFRSAGSIQGKNRERVVRVHLYEAREAQGQNTKKLRKASKIPVLIKNISASKTSCRSSPKPSPVVIPPHTTVEFESYMNATSVMRKKTERTHKRPVNVTNVKSIFQDSHTKQNFTHSDMPHWEEDLCPNERQQATNSVPHRTRQHPYNDKKHVSVDKFASFRSTNSNLPRAGRRDKFREGINTLPCVPKTNVRHETVGPRRPKPVEHCGIKTLSTGWTADIRYPGTAAPASVNTRCRRYKGNPPSNQERKIYSLMNRKGRRVQEVKKDNSYSDFCSWWSSHVSSSSSHERINSSPPSTSASGYYSSGRSSTHSSISTNIDSVSSGFTRTSSWQSISENIPSNFQAFHDQNPLHKKTSLYSDTNEPKCNSDRVHNSRSPAKSPKFSAEDETSKSDDYLKQMRSNESSLSTLRSISDLPFNSSSNSKSTRNEQSALNSQNETQFQSTLSYNSKNRQDLKRHNFNFSNKKCLRSSSEPNLTTSSIFSTNRVVRSSVSLLNLKSEDELRSKKRKSGCRTLRYHFPSSFFGKNSAPYGRLKNLDGKVIVQRSCRDKKGTDGRMTETRGGSVKSGQTLTEFLSDIKSVARDKRIMNKSHNKSPNKLTTPARSHRQKYSIKSFQTQHTNPAQGHRKNASRRKTNLNRNEKSHSSIALPNNCHFKTGPNLVKCEEKNENSPRSLPRFAKILRFWENKTLYNVGNTFRNIFKGYSILSPASKESDPGCKVSPKNSKTDSTLYESVIDTDYHCSIKQTTRPSPRKAVKSFHADCEAGEKVDQFNQLFHSEHSVLKLETKRQPAITSTNYDLFDNNSISKNPSPVVQETPRFRRPPQRLKEKKFTGMDSLSKIRFPVRRKRRRKIFTSKKYADDLPAMTYGSGDRSKLFDRDQATKIDKFPHSIQLADKVPQKNHCHLEKKSSNSNEVVLGNDRHDVEPKINVPGDNMDWNKLTQIMLFLEQAVDREAATRNMKDETACQVDGDQFPTIPTSATVCPNSQMISLTRSERHVHKCRTNTKHRLGKMGKQRADLNCWAVAVANNIQPRTGDNDRLRGDNEIYRDDEGFGFTKPNVNSMPAPLPIPVQVKTKATHLYKPTLCIGKSPTSTNQDLDKEKTCDVHQKESANLLLFDLSPARTDSIQIKYTDKPTIMESWTDVQNCKEQGNLDKAVQAEQKNAKQAPISNSVVSEGEDIEYMISTGLDYKSENSSTSTPQNKTTFTNEASSRTSFQAPKHRVLESETSSQSCSNQKSKNIGGQTKRQQVDPRGKVPLAHVSPRYNRNKVKNAPEKKETLPERLEKVSRTRVPQNTCKTSISGLGRRVRATGPRCENGVSFSQLSSNQESKETRETTLSTSRTMLDFSEVVVVISPKKFSEGVSNDVKSKSVSSQQNTKGQIHSSEFDLVSPFPSEIMKASTETHVLSHTSTGTVSNVHDSSASTPFDDRKGQAGNASTAKDCSLDERQLNKLSSRVRKKVNKLLKNTETQTDEPMKCDQIDDWKLPTDTKKNAEERRLEIVRTSNESFDSERQMENRQKYQIQSPKATVWKRCRRQCPIPELTLGTSPSEMLTSFDYSKDEGGKQTDHNDLEKYNTFCAPDVQPTRRDRESRLFSQHDLNIRENKTLLEQVRTETRRSPGKAQDTCELFKATGVDGSLKKTHTNNIKLSPGLIHLTDFKKSFEPVAHTSKLCRANRRTVLSDSSNTLKSDSSLHYSCKMSNSKLCISEDIHCFECTSEGIEESQQTQSRMKCLTLMRKGFLTSSIQSPPKTQNRHLGPYKETSNVDRSSLNIIKVGESPFAEARKLSCLKSPLVAKETNISSTQKQVKWGIPRSALSPLKTTLKQSKHTEQHQRFAESKFGGNQKHRNESQTPPRRSNLLTFTKGESSEDASSQKRRSEKWVNESPGKSSRKQLKNRAIPKDKYYCNKEMKGKERALKQTTKKSPNFVNLLDLPGKALGSESTTVSPRVKRLNSSTLRYEEECEEDSETFRSFELSSLHQCRASGMPSKSTRECSLACLQSCKNKSCINRNDEGERSRHHFKPQKISSWESSSCIDNRNKDIRQYKPTKSVNMETSNVGSKREFKGSVRMAQNDHKNDLTLKRSLGNPGINKRTEGKYKKDRVMAKSKISEVCSRSQRHSAPSAFIDRRCKAKRTDSTFRLPVTGSKEQYLENINLFSIKIDERIQRSETQLSGVGETFISDSSSVPETTRHIDPDGLRKNMKMELEKQRKYSRNKGIKLTKHSSAPCSTSFADLSNDTLRILEEIFTMNTFTSTSNCWEQSSKGSKATYIESTEEIQFKNKNLDGETVGEKIDEVGKGKAARSKSHFPDVTFIDDGKESKSTYSPSKSRDIEIVLGNDIPVDEFMKYLMNGIQVQSNNSRLPSDSQTENCYLKSQVRLVIDKIFGNESDVDCNGAKKSTEHSKDKNCSSKKNEFSKIRSQKHSYQIAKQESPEKIYGKDKKESHLSENGCGMKNSHKKAGRIGGRSGNIERVTKVARVAAECKTQNVVDVPPDICSKNMSSNKDKEETHSKQDAALKPGVSCNNRSHVKTEGKTSFENEISFVIRDFQRKDGKMKHRGSKAYHRSGRSQRAHNTVKTSSGSDGKNNTSRSASDSVLSVHLIRKPARERGGAYRQRCVEQERKKVTAIPDNEKRPRLSVAGLNIAEKTAERLRVMQAASNYEAPRCRKLKMDTITFTKPQECCLENVTKRDSKLTVTFATPSTIKNCVKSAISSPDLDSTVHGSHKGLYATLRERDTLRKPKVQSAEYIPEIKYCTAARKDKMMQLPESLESPKARHKQHKKYVDGRGLQLHYTEGSEGDKEATLRSRKSSGENSGKSTALRSDETKQQSSSTVYESRRSTEDTSLDIISSSQMPRLMTRHFLSSTTESKTPLSSNDASKSTMVPEHSLKISRTKIPVHTLQKNKALKSTLISESWSTDPDTKTSAEEKEKGNRSEHRNGKKSKQVVNSESFKTSATDSSSKAKTDSNLLSSTSHETEDELQDISRMLISYLSQRLLKGSSRPSKREHKKSRRTHERGNEKIEKIKEMLSGCNAISNIPVEGNGVGDVTGAQMQTSLVDNITPSSGLREAHTEGGISEVGTKKELTVSTDVSLGSQQMMEDRPCGDSASCNPIPRESTGVQTAESVLAIKPPSKPTEIHTTQQRAPLAPHQSFIKTTEKSTKQLNKCVQASILSETTLFPEGPHAVCANSVPNDVQISSAENTIEISKRKDKCFMAWPPEGEKDLVPKAENVTFTETVSEPLPGNIPEQRPQLYTESVEIAAIYPSALNRESNSTGEAKTATETPRAVPQNTATEETGGDMSQESSYSLPIPVTHFPSQHGDAETFKEYKMKAPCSFYTPDNNVSVSLVVCHDQKSSSKCVKLTLHHGDSRPAFEVFIEPDERDAGSPKVVAEHGFVHVSYDKTKKDKAKPRQKDSKKGGFNESEMSTEETSNVESTTESSPPRSPITSNLPKAPIRPLKSPSGGDVRSSSYGTDLMSTLISRREDEKISYRDSQLTARHSSHSSLNSSYDLDRNQVFKKINSRFQECSKRSQRQYYIQTNFDDKPPTQKQSGSKNYRQSVAHRITGPPVTRSSFEDVSTRNTWKWRENGGTSKVNFQREVSAEKYNSPYSATPPPSGTPPMTRFDLDFWKRRLNTTTSSNVEGTYNNSLESGETNTLRQTVQKSERGSLTTDNRPNRLPTEFSYLKSTSSEEEKKPGIKTQRLRQTGHEDKSPVDEEDILSRMKVKRPSGRTELHNLDKLLTQGKEVSGSDASTGSLSSPEIKRIVASNISVSNDMNAMRNKIRSWRPIIDNSIESPRKSSPSYEDKTKDEAFTQSYRSRLDDGITQQRRSRKEDEVSKSFRPRNDQEMTERYRSREERRTKTTEESEREETDSTSDASTKKNTDFDISRTSPRLRIESLKNKPATSTMETSPTSRGDSMGEKGLTRLRDQSPNGSKTSEESSSSTFSSLSRSSPTRTERSKLFKVSKKPYEADTWNRSEEERQDISIKNNRGKIQTRSPSPILKSRNSNMEFLETTGRSCTFSSSSPSPRSEAFVVKKNNLGKCFIAGTSSSPEQTSPTRGLDTKEPAFFMQRKKPEIQGDSRETPISNQKVNTSTSNTSVRETEASLASDRVKNWDTLPQRQISPYTKSMSSSQNTGSSSCEQKYVSRPSSLSQNKGSKSSQCRVRFADEVTEFCTPCTPTGNERTSTSMRRYDWPERNTQSRDEEMTTSRYSLPSSTRPPSSNIFDTMSYGRPHDMFPTSQTMFNTGVSQPAYHGHGFGAQHQVYSEQPRYSNYSYYSHDYNEPRQSQPMQRPWLSTNIQRQRSSNVLRSPRILYNQSKSYASPNTPPKMLSTQKADQADSGYSNQSTPNDSTAFVTSEWDQTIQENLRQRSQRFRNLLSKEGLLDLGVRLPYMKVGPLRLLHASYLLMGIICMLAGHVMVKLYQCGGDDYEYFCPEDDLECLMQLFPAAA